MKDYPVIRCRVCGEHAVGVYHMPKGCVCAPDPIQALCAQHVIRAEPIAGMWAIIEGTDKPLAERLRLLEGA